MQSIHISKVKVGDVVFHAGKERTVGKDDIKYDSFMGNTLFGDSYSLGYKPVMLAVKGQ